MVVEVVVDQRRGTRQRAGVRGDLGLRSRGHQHADVNREHRRRDERHEPEPDRDEREAPLIVQDLPAPGDAGHGYCASLRIWAEAESVMGVPSVVPRVTRFATGLSTMNENG